MNIQQQFSLKSLNTLNLESIAAYYAQIDSMEMLQNALDFAEINQLNVLVLSGGSNMLLPEQINALVIHMNIQGIEYLDSDENIQKIKVGAGQNWHEFVLWTTQQHLFGLQNLALIPGLVGAAPVQNIGAYGVEVGEFIDSVCVFDRFDKKIKKLAASQCDFAYRHSIFKDDPSRYIITQVIFQLLKKPKLTLAYGDLQKAVGDDQTALNLQNQVISIRKNKLPDPAQYPNAGSFFKNPLIDAVNFQQLIQKFPHMPNYPQKNGQYKIAAGWLIEQAGWKGKRLGSVGMFEKQALVLVNYANANLHEVQATYRAVQKDVLNQFGVLLEPEPVLFSQQGLIVSH